MVEIFQYSFMIRAFLAGIMIAVIAPLIGNYLVIRRYSLIADTLSHIALTGVALGFLLGTQPLFMTLLVTIISALAIEQLRRAKKIPGEAVLAMFLPGGLALSVVLISISNGFNANLFSYLFGSITTVKTEELWYIGILGMVTVLIILLFRKRLLYASLDEESAKISGISVEWMSTVLLVLTAITVSLSMRVVGILLVGALMVIPVISAMQIATSFKQTAVFSVIFAFIAVVIGLFAAYYLTLPAGGAIVLMSLGLFGLISLFKSK